VGVTERKAVRGNSGMLLVWGPLEKGYENGRKKRVATPANSPGVAMNSETKA